MSREWIEPEDDAQRLRFIDGLNAGIARADDEIADLLAQVDELRTEQRRDASRVRDLEEWTW